jgi:RNA polymerase sigma-70 factor (ECF subfamily)
MDGNPTDAEWRRWLEDHSAKFWLYARQKARSEADAQDLMQEAIIEAAQRIGNGNPPPAALVFATLHRRAIDWGRQEDRRRARELAISEPASVPWFDTGVEDRERAKAIQGALQKLPEIYREVVTLKIWGELTFLEIADMLQIPANTAASRYRYGLQELRKLAREVLT